MKARNVSSLQELQKLKISDPLTMPFFNFSLWISLISFLSHGRKKVLHLTSYNVNHLRDTDLSQDPYHKIFCKRPQDWFDQMPSRPVNEVTLDVVIVPAIITWVGSQGKEFGFQTSREFASQKSMSCTLTMKDRQSIPSFVPDTQ